MQINNNIKLIRELSGLKQVDFARLIKTNVSNLKAYENTNVRPKANILVAISEISGVPVEQLDNPLTYKDINFNIKKDKKVKYVDLNENTTNVSEPDIPYFNDKERLINEKDRLIEEKEARRQDAERHIKQILEEKEKLYDIIDKLQTSFDSQLTNLNLVAQSILLSQRAEHTVMFEAFDRLEKNKPGTLSLQADKKEFELRETVLKADMKVKAGK